MKTDDSLYNLIAVMPSLVPFTASEKRLLTRSLHVRQFAAHEQIYPAAGPAVAAYYIIEGSVGLFQPNKNRVLDRIAYFKARQWFGYSTFFPECRRDTSTKALEQTRCFVLFRTEYLKIAEKNSTCALKILTNICYDLDTTLQEIQRDYFSLTAKLTRANIVI